MFQEKYYMKTSPFDKKKKGLHGALFNFMHFYFTPVHFNIYEAWHFLYMYAELFGWFHNIPNSNTDYS